MKIKISHSPVYIIVEEGLIANFNLADGRMIPAVVVKSNDGDKTVENLVKLHVGTPSGDVEVTWGNPLSIFLRDKVWNLTLKFSNPTECEFNIQFDLTKEYRLIDAIFISRGLYISYGDKGDKVSQLKNGTVLIEVPNTGIDTKWEEKLNEILYKKLKKKHRLPKNELKKLVQSVNQEARELLYFQKKL